MGSIVRIFTLAVTFLCLSIAACLGSLAIYYSCLPFNSDSCFDRRLIANGYLDEMLYERGKINQTLPFTEMKKRSLINQRAKAAEKSKNFSGLIRVGLPGMEL